MSEKELFAKIREEIPGLTKAEDQYSRYDCYTENSLIELKCLTRDHKEILIEEKKYQALLSEAVLAYKTPYYVVSTPAGIWVFNVNEIREPTWTTIRTNSTTHFGGPQVEKVVGFISKEESR